jgi:hypothetical protein
MSFEVQDCNGSKLSVGDRVLYDDYTATITKITEPDADYDDELGRAVENCPSVYITYDAVVPEAADKEICNTYNDTKVTWADYPNGPAHSIYLCEDLELIVE